MTSAAILDNVNAKNVEAIIFWFLNNLFMCKHLWEVPLEYKRPGFAWI